MKKSIDRYNWLGGDIETLSPEECREKIRILEAERARIGDELDETIELYIKESGNTSLRIKKTERNPYLLDGAQIGSEAFEQRRVADQIYVKPKK